MQNINVIMEYKYDNFVKGVLHDDSHMIQTDDMLQQQNTLEWEQFEHFYPYFKEYSPVYLGWQNENKTEKAFKIVNILLKQKIIKVDKVKDFVELVNTVAKEI